MKASTVISFVISSCFAATAHGFSAPSRPVDHVDFVAANSRRKFGAKLVGAFLVTPLVFQPKVAHSQELAPTSLLLADNIKTLDMSLPSYNDISDAKASVETVQSLSAGTKSKAPQAGGTSSGTKKPAEAKKQPPAPKKPSSPTVKYEF